MKRLFAVTLSIVMLFLLCSCNPGESLLDSISDIKSEDESVEPGIDKIGYKIPYDRTDSLNPFKTSGAINRCIISLLYDSLYAVDNSFNAVSVMASSSNIKDNSLTVILKSDLKFTDGSPVSGSDVVYSFEKAKDSKAYSAYLNNISAAKSNGNTVIFTMLNQNKNEASNLVFPIIKSDSDITQSKDKSEIIPVGSGRYFIKDENGTKTLYANKNRLGGYHPKYNMTGLTAVTESSSVQSLFSLGEIDAYVNDYGNGQFSNYSGIGKNYETTNMVYLGINSNSSVLSDIKVRRAIALLLNRTDLADVSFAGHAVSTSVPFHPDYSELKGCTLPTLKSNTASASKLLDEAGYDLVSSRNIRYSSEGKTLEVTLLVNADNSFKISLARSIQQSLERAKISVNLKEYSYNSYVRAVEQGSYSIYIGEAKLSNNFDLSRFFTEGGSLSYGIDTSGKCASAYLKYRSSEISMQSFIDCFADELPIIPIAFRKGLTIKSSKIAQDIVSTPDNCFSNINDWTVS